MKKLLQLEHVTMQFGGVVAVNDLSLHVDTGEIHGGVIDFSSGLGDVTDIVDLMAEMQQSIKASYFPPKRNRFCKWCDFFKTSKCTL